MIYLELEDRLYRHPDGQPLSMSLWNRKARRWEPYRGDTAKVLTEGERVPKPKSVTD